MKFLNVGQQKMEIDSNEKIGKAMLISTLNLDAVNILRKSS